MPLGDLLFSLMGKPDPSLKLAQAMAGNSAGSSVGLQSAMGSVGSGQPNSAAGQPRIPVDPNSAVQPQQAPQQPAAYQSAPDFVGIYKEMADRADANRMIDRGMTLLAAGLSNHDSVRQSLLGSLGSGSGPSPESEMNNMVGLYGSMQKMQMAKQTMAALPLIARQLNMSPEQVQAAYASGALDNILVEQFKQGTPLTRAQIEEARQRIGLVQAQTAEAQAGIPLKQAQTAKEQAELAGTIPDDQMKELNSLNVARKAQGLSPLDILSYKMFSQPLDPASRAYYMAHPEAMPSGTAMNGVAPGTAAPGMSVGSPNASAPAAPAFGSQPPSGSPLLDIIRAQAARSQGQPQATPRAQQSAPAQAAPAVPSFEEASKSNFNDIPPVMPKLVSVQPIPGESMQTWQARQGQASAINDAATKAAATDQQESISALKDGTIEQIGTRVQHLQSLLSSPLLPYAVGKFAGRLPNWVLPQDLEDFRAQLKQAQEAVYQTATTSLKGVTNRATQQEIGRVAEALGKLDATNQSPDAYRQAIGENLNDLASAALRTTQNAGVAPPDWLKGYKPTQPAPITAVKPGLADSSSQGRPMTSSELSQAQSMVKQHGRDAVIKYLRSKGVSSEGL